MIQVSEIFSLCGMEGVPDVATSLASQNILAGISIPIFGGIYLKIIPNSELGLLCNNLREVGILQHFGRSCGTVGITLNVLNMNILTLLECVCAFTPRTGAKVFFKNSVPNVDVTELTVDIVKQLVDISAIPFDQFGNIGNNYLIDIANRALAIIFDKLIRTLEIDFRTHSIITHNWEELETFRNELIRTGEMQWMQRIRLGYQLPII